MTENTPEPTPPEDPRTAFNAGYEKYGPKIEPSDALVSAPNPFTLSAAKKGYSAGLAATIVAVGGLAGPVLADGALSGPELATIIGTAVVAFVGGFFAAWVPTNR